MANKPQRLREIHVRVTLGELARIRRSAKELGLNLSNYFRFRVLARPERATETVTPLQSPRREEVSP